MNNLGERLWVGYWGESFVGLAFVMAFFGAIAFFMATQKRQNLSLSADWQRMARVAFGLHSLAIFAVIGLIFTLQINKYFEYKYAYDHVSEDLPLRYLFSAFWEGQEGSFLLWMFWHIILGCIVIFRKDIWETPVLAVICLVQALLTLMIWGGYPLGTNWHIGVNPFTLLRDVTDAPIFSQPNYVAQIKGDGLSPLLQNYWMTIHPPTLFLGFASTIMPFAYSIAGLWIREHKAWLKPAYRWSLFSAFIFGTGIAMGGAWAYEALSFGGYWAWDPVENASLVPWLILVAGVHTAMIAQRTEYSYRATHIFFLSSFLFVLYSTFLTRSGILGQTSVHSFTELGLEAQLIILQSVLAVVALFFLVTRWKQIPSHTTEESGYSKEFWMFMGALILIFSSVIITATTSIPVYNKLFGTNFAPPQDVVGTHNAQQIWVGMLLCILSGVAQYLRYNQTKTQPDIYKKLGLQFLVALVLGCLFSWFAGFVSFQLYLLYITAIFTIIANGVYFITIMRGQFRLAASVVSHLGLGILMVGVLYSGAKKEPLSVGFNEIQGPNNNPQTNRSVLVPFNQAVRMKENRTAQGVLQSYYEVKYVADTVIDNSEYYRLKFYQRDSSGHLLSQFQVEPNSMFSILPSGERKFAASNPGTQHYVGSDVFNIAVPHWAFSSPEDQQKEKQFLQDSLEWSTHLLKQGDSIRTKNYHLVYQGINRQPQLKDVDPKAYDILVASNFKVVPIVKDPDTSYIVEPLFAIKDKFVESPIMFNSELGLLMKFMEIIPASAEVKVTWAQTKPQPKYVVLQTLLFPGINLVWIGKIMLMFGFIMALIVRIRLKM